MKKSRWKETAGIALMAGVLGIGGTFAWFTAYDKKENLLAVGHNTTTITEDFPKPSPIPIPENPEYKKTVCVSNYTSGENGFGVDCYVRVMLSCSNSDIGNAVTLLGLNTTDWEQRSDGYYYYKKILREGQKTTPLFTGFRIDSSQVMDTYRPWLDEFSIEVYEESVQAEGFADAQSAWAHFTGPVGI